MNGFGQQAYRAMAVNSGVSAADPHALVLMLYDGALEAIRIAQGHLAAGHIAEKGAALGKAVRILEEGLKASVDRGTGGQLAFRLLDLYDYMTMRLLQANLRNDRNALTEVARLMAELRAAWAQIKLAAPRAAEPALPSSLSAAPPARRVAIHA
jgi:flagellar protein FliS